MFLLGLMVGMVIGATVGYMMCALLTMSKKWSDDYDSTKKDT